MALVTYFVGALAGAFGLFLWTILTFLAIDQNDPLVWRLAPLFAGVVAAVPVVILSGWQSGIIVGVLVAGLSLLAGRILLDSFSEVRRSYLDEHS